MPFRGRLHGEIVSPAEIDNGQVVACPECGGGMYPRGGDEVARHFYHIKEQRGQDCPSAEESDTHRRCKALAAAVLNDEWGEQATRLGVEMGIDVSYTPTDKDRRQADALVECESRNEFYGSGVVLEVQYRNKSKDIRETTYDYISADYSVAWLEPQHFESEQLEFGLVETLFEEYPNRHNWQGPNPIEVGHAISVRYRTPDTFGKLPDTLETYRSYPNPRTDWSEHRWDIAKNPWR